MEDIITRVPGCSNREMLEKVGLLKGIIESGKFVEVGRGKNKETMFVHKHKTEEEVSNRIINSYEYYKGLVEKEESEPLSSSIVLRDYQVDIIHRGCKILEERGFLYLSMQVRTGKTLTSLGIAQKMGANRVLFVTKKKAISSISDDYSELSPKFYILIINYESLHKVEEGDWDLVICDEAHSMGAFPKPSDRAKEINKIISKNFCSVILLSGTPTPESYSQMYHQVYGIPGNPFGEFTNFYRFCDVHVKVKPRMINGNVTNDYSEGLPSIMQAMEPYMISYTQKEAGFSSEIKEEVLTIELKESTYKLIAKLKKDLVINGKEEVILADTPVKLMMKVHQLCSGTVKFESENSMVIDTTKAEFIKDRFSENRIGIFYKFKEELNAIKSVFGKDVATELEDFDSGKCKNIALQIVSGREGISLKNADFIVYYNIDFSATSYWQSRDRMTTMDRLENIVYWVFSKGGIEWDIYKAVKEKKDYTLSHFKKTL